MPTDTRPPAIALMGPTASGKTALALDWAQRFDGEILSVDSALVYRGLDIGAAKPDAAERARAPHHMLDLRDPWQSYSAAEFAADARAAIDGILARGRMPILAGGTGLYFHALLRGLSAMPEADAEVRAAIDAQARMHGWPALHDQLARVDPNAATRIHGNDAQRIQRALEVFRISGRPISDWQRQAPASAARLPCRVLKVIVAPRDRALLHARIAQRFDAMLDGGFLDEMHALRALPELAERVRANDSASRIAPTLPALRAVGYRQAWEHLEGATSREAFRDRAIFATRQLAKRQLTWLRGELDARWFDPAADAARIDAALALFLGGGRQQPAA
ncbi:MAG: tRNA (adenosine(37)-N6)-dimethylallyltransferase MiaA [Luteimonas sp.]